LLGFTSLSFFFYFGLPNYCEFNVQSLFISARLADRLGTNNRINAVITIRMGFTECLYYFPGAVPIFPVLSPFSQLDSAAINYWLTS